MHFKVNKFPDFAVVIFILKVCAFLSAVDQEAEVQGEDYYFIAHTLKRSHTFFNVPFYLLHFHAFSSPSVSFIFCFSLFSFSVLEFPFLSLLLSECMNYQH